MHVRVYREYNVCARDMSLDWDNNVINVFKLF